MREVLLAQQAALAARLAALEAGERGGTDGRRGSAAGAEVGHDGGGLGAHAPDPRFARRGDEHGERGAEGARPGALQPMVSPDAGGGANRPSARDGDGGGVGSQRRLLGELQDTVRTPRGARGGGDGAAAGGGRFAGAADAGAGGGGPAAGDRRGCGGGRA